MSGQREYRIRWQRLDMAPKLRIYQTRAGAEKFKLVLEGRLAELTGLGPGEPACCSGRECGCEGETNAEIWAKAAEGIPPLVVGPHIEARAVGRWGPYPDLTDLA